MAAIIPEEDLEDVKAQGYEILKTTKADIIAPGAQFIFQAKASKKVYRVYFVIKILNNKAIGWEFEKAILWE